MAKKDGSLRFCVDYRAVNSVTYRDAYPLPLIDNCLNAMHGAAWFSTLDLRAGYHNIPVAEVDRDKTVFIMRRGCYSSSSSSSRPDRRRSLPSPVQQPIRDQDTDTWD